MERDHLSSVKRLDVPRMNLRVVRAISIAAEYQRACDVALNVTELLGEAHGRGAWEQANRKLAFLADLLEALSAEERAQYTEAVRLLERHGPADD